MNGFTLTVILAFLGGGCLWAKTSRSPFWWGIVVFTVLEAIRFEAWVCLVPAYVEFVRRVRVRVVLIKEELGGLA